VLAMVPVTMSKRRGSGRRACRPERGQHIGPMGTVEWIGLNGCRRVDAGIGGYPADQHAADRSPGGWSRRVRLEHHWRLGRTTRRLGSDASDSSTAPIATLTVNEPVAALGQRVATHTADSGGQQRSRKNRQFLGDSRQ
jgi:hypothetical protein